MGKVLYFSDLHGPPRPVFLNRWVATHFWVASTLYWDAKTFSRFLLLCVSPNCVQFFFVGRQPPPVENNCPRPSQRTPG